MLAKNKNSQTCLYAAAASMIPVESSMAGVRMRQGASVTGE